MSAIPVAVSALVVGLWSVLGPRRVIETIAHPRQVAAVRRDGLEFVDGSRVSWKIAADTPAVLELVRDATLRGVERTPEGRAIGLLDIHHWCGTGRRVRHRARVDLERLIEFFEGGPSPRTNEPRVCFGDPPNVTRFGWNVSDWWEFETWCGADPNRVWR